MLTSLVQEDNWTNPVTVEDLATANRHDLVCERHKNMHYNCGVLLVHLIDGFTIEESNIPFKQVLILCVLIIFKSCDVYDQL